MLAVSVTELLLWLVTTAGLRLYWHSAHLHQLPLPLTLLWLAKAACSVVLAIVQASWTSHSKQSALVVSFWLERQACSCFLITGRGRCKTELLNGWQWLFEHDHQLLELPCLS